MAEEKKASKSEPADEYGNTLEAYKEAHGGRSPDEVNPPSEPESEKHHEEKAKARWG